MRHGPVGPDCRHFASCALEELLLSYSVRHIDAKIFPSICKMSRADIITKGAACVKEVDKARTNKWTWSWLMMSEAGGS